MYALAAEAVGGAILESNFHRRLATARLLELEGDIIEVFCLCDRETALGRYRTRMNDRDAVHLDVERSDAELWDPETTIPIAGGWPVLEVDTTQEPDVDWVAEGIRALLYDHLASSP
jgi:hypothetical protein